MDDQGEPTEEARREALGRHLRALRNGRRWTQEKLREESGVSTTTIRAIEKNYPSKRGRNPTTLQALSKALGRPNNYFINYFKNPPEEDLSDQFASTATAPQRSDPDLIRIANLMPELIARLGGIETQLGRIAEAHNPAPGDADHHEEDN